MNLLDFNKWNCLILLCGAIKFWPEPSFQKFYSKIIIIIIIKFTRSLIPCICRNYICMAFVFSATIERDSINAIR